MFTTVFIIIAVIAWSVGVSKNIQKYDIYSGVFHCDDNCDNFWYTSNDKYTHGPAGWYIAIIAAALGGVAQLMFQFA